MSQPSSPDQLRVGIIGAGGIFPSHANAWRDLGATVISYSDDGQHHEKAELYGARAVNSIEDLLAEVDAVDICTPTPSHPTLVEQAAAAGRHVVCEKPLALTSGQAQRLAALCADAGVQLHVGQVVRFFPAYAAAKHGVDAGQIGEPAVLRLSRRGARPTRGWFADPAQSGGILLDQTIHDIDFARWVAGEVVEVFARQSGDLSNPDDTIAAHCILTHASGAVSQCAGVWGVAGLPFETSFSIAGSGGEIHHNSLDHSPLQVVTGEGPVSGPTGQQNPMFYQMQEFAAALCGGPAPRVSPDDAVAAVRLAEAAAASMTSGEPVRVAGVAAAQPTEETKA